MSIRHAEERTQKEKAISLPGGVYGPVWMRTQDLRRRLMEPDTARHTRPTGLADGNHVSEATRGALAERLLPPSGF